METRILRKKIQSCQYFEDHTTKMLSKRFGKKFSKHMSTIAKLQNSAKVFIVSITTGHVTSGAHGRNIFPWSTIKTLYTEIRWKLCLYKANEIVLTEA